MIEFVINELSLVGRYHEAASFQEASVEFVYLVHRVRSAARTLPGAVWRSAQFPFVRATQGDPVVALVNRMPDRDLREAYLEIVREVISWEPHRVHHADDVYHCHDDVVTDTSVAEAAARARQAETHEACLVNYAASSFGDNVVVTFNQTESVPLRGFAALQEFERYIEHVEGFKRYGPDAAAPPRDEQTLLSDRTRFSPTNRSYDGRRVYRHVVTGDLYYVDNLHHGPAAHLEVFDRYGRHKGEASLEGVLKSGTRISERRLDT